jgi:hypothetical protein
LFISKTVIGGGVGEWATGGEGAGIGDGGGGGVGRVAPIKLLGGVIRTAVLVLKSV